MVKALYITALLFASAAHAEDTAMGFQTECSKTEVFEGETVSCSFIIASSEDVIDVEVAKFPEFRGFWSENVALRQGPIPLMSGLIGDSVRKGIIGTYTLIPMVGKPDASIEPMKIVVRRPLSAIEAELVVNSEPASLKIKPLPPVPPEYEAAAFQGAVGSFSILVETHEVAFRKDEPSMIRISLQGEGNFPEINELKLSLPEHTDVLSRRAITQGSGQYSVKTFEITVAPHTEEDFSTAATPFLYFNPLQKKYDKLLIPEIRFVKAPSSAAPAETLKEPLPLRDYETEWSNYAPLHHSFAFWAVQLLLLIVSLALIVKQIGEDYFRRQAQSPRFQRRLRAEVAVAALGQGGVELFLRIADEIAYEILIEEAKLPSGISRSQALTRAKGKVAPERLNAIESLCRAHETYAYSPHKTLPMDTADLSRALAHLTGALLPVQSAA